MIIYLVRHAKAGGRLADYRDRFRPLSPEGHNQAGRIATFLAAAGTDSIWTSPAVRCQQTVEPLAKKLSVPAVESDSLWEDSYPTDIINLMNSSVAASSVFCSHGNLIPSVIQILQSEGVQIDRDGTPRLRLDTSAAKGSIWTVRGEPNDWRLASYTSPDQFR